MSNSLEEHIICSCGNAEHLVLFKGYEKDNYRELGIYIHLTNLSRWKRIKEAFRLLFGISSKIGQFAEIIIPYQDYWKFKKVSNYLKTSYSRYEKNNDDIGHEL